MCPSLRAGSLLPRLGSGPGAARRHCWWAVDVLAGPAAPALRPHARPLPSTATVAGQGCGGGGRVRRLTEPLETHPASPSQKRRRTPQNPAEQPSRGGDFLMATTGTTTWPLTTVYARIWKTELIATTKGRASRSRQG